MKQMNLLVNVILKQNYLTFYEKFFAQIEGLAMGLPLTGLIADIYLNNYENTCLLTNNNKFLNRIILCE